VSAANNGRATRPAATAAIAIVAAFIVVLDNSVLNVAIPTILRDRHDVARTRWVIAVTLTSPRS
jgi:hypothetical protein